MGTTIALAGKGGTGKTTLAALTVRYLEKTGSPSILAVDADPNATLHEALGVEIDSTVGRITEELLQSVEDLPPGMSKDTWMEYHMQQILVETKRFDLLSMGQPEGPGCYCFANSLVRRYVDILAQNYDYVVLDNEAGMEHLSRRTTRDVDVLLLVSDASMRGIRTVARLSTLADDLKISIGRRYVVIDRAPASLDPVLEAELAAGGPYLGLQFLGTIPDDEAIGRFDLEGRAVLDLPDDSAAVVASAELLERVLAGSAGGASAGNA